MSQYDEINTEAAVVANLAAQLPGNPQVLQVETEGLTIPVLLLPKNLQLVDIEKQLNEQRGAPRRLSGTARALSLDSFIALVNRYGDDDCSEEVMQTDADAVVYADDGSAPKLVAVLNDHADDAPGFRDHRVVYEPQLSDEWKAWVGANDKLVSQAEFAQFLEDHALDLVEQSSAGTGASKIIDALAVTVASPASLRALARDMQVRVKQNVKEARNLANGETEVVFASEHTDAGGRPLVVPGAFLIAIPVYVNGPLYVLVARLRYRVAEGRILWSYKLAHHESAKKDSMADMLKRLREETGALVVEGQP